MKPRTLKRRTAPAGAYRAFSLVELLVVVAILGILLGIVYKGGGAPMDQGKSRDTQALLQSLQQAIEEYRSEVGPSRIPNATRAFNGAPPDDLFVFNPAVTAKVGWDITMVRSPAQIDLGSPEDPTATQYWDVRAMLLAMRLQSPKAATILDRIDGRFKKTDSAVFYPDGPATTATAINLMYLVDAWGTPLEYYATAGYSAPDVKAADRLRLNASVAFLQANNGDPLLVSYGPNGPEQFDPEIIASGGSSTLVDDWNADAEGHIDHPLNQDNVYSSETFSHRMAGEH